MNRSGRWVASALLTVLTACGVHYGFVGGGLPENIRTVAVLPFDNQTTSTEVQSELHDALRKEMQGRLGVRDASEDRADAVVRGVIQAYDADVPVAYSADPNRAVTARRHLQITVDIEIVDQTTGRLLYQRKGLRGEAEYAERAEAEGRRVAIQQLVDQAIQGAQSQW